MLRQYLAFGGLPRRDVGSMQVNLYYVALNVARSPLQQCACGTSTNIDRDSQSREWNDAHTVGPVSTSFSSPFEASISTCAISLLSEIGHSSRSDPTCRGRVSISEATLEEPTVHKQR